MQFKSFNVKVDVLLFVGGDLPVNHYRSSLIDTISSIGSSVQYFKS